MLIIKRSAGQIVVIENADERFEIEVLAVRHGRASLDVAGNTVSAHEGMEIAVSDAALGPLLIVVDRIGDRGVRLGFKGDLSRRIYRKEKVVVAAPAPQLPDPMSCDRAA